MQPELQLENVRDFLVSNRQRNNEAKRFVGSKNKKQTHKHTHTYTHEIHSSIIIQYAMLANLLSVVANVITKNSLFVTEVCVCKKIERK